MLADGTHKVRIAISHNGTTRYFLTRFILPSADNLCNGQVVGVPNALYMNQQIMARMTEIYTAFDTITDAEYLSCSQLIEQIELAIKSSAPKTLCEVCEELLKLRRGSISEGSYTLYDYGFKLLMEHYSTSFLIKNLSSQSIAEYKDYISKRYSSTTVKMRLAFLRMVVRYAIKHKYVSYDVPPFEEIDMPKPNVRNCHLTIEQLRKIRDFDFSKEKTCKQLSYVRDVFMLSFYLCGINIIDLLQLDLSGDTISYERTKNKNSKKQDTFTTFTMPAEAKDVAARLIDKNGRLMQFGKKPTYSSLNDLFYAYFDKIKGIAGIDANLIYYSARKTFAQIANELMIKDSIIEYCIGDAVHKNRILGSYVTVTPKMADKAIRKVMDAVASSKTMDELMDEA